MNTTNNSPQSECTLDQLRREVDELRGNFKEFTKQIDELIAKTEVILHYVEGNQAMLESILKHKDGTRK